MKTVFSVFAIVFSTLFTKAQNSDLNNFKYLEYDIAKIQNLYLTKRTTVKDVVKAYLDRIEKIDKKVGLNSVICTNPDALLIADSLDRIPLDKRNGALFGIPVLLKDNIDTHDKMPTTAGSLALKNSFPLKDSEVAKKLREAGAVIIGKTNLSEWANFRGMNSTSGWSAVGGLTKNPYDLTRNACGSSSGSGAAVSANFAVLAIGTETNGSIMCPSSLNGLVGIKPTVGLISRSGIVPISYTQDTPGPMARTVRDAAIALGTMVGVDTGDDKTSASKDHFKTDYTQYLTLNGLKGKRFGFPKNMSNGNVKTDELFKKALEFLKSQGATVVETEKIIDDSAEDNSLNLMIYEYKDGLNNYFASLGPNAPIKTVSDLIEFNKNSPEELQYFGQEYLITANKTSGMADPKYAEVVKLAAEGSRENGIDKIMKEYNLDAIIAPTSTPAWKSDLVNGDCNVYESSSPAAISCYPHITVPMGNIDGLPVGISFYAEAWSEGKLIEMAYTFEQTNPQRIVQEYKYGK
jgi:amidase